MRISIFMKRNRILFPLGIILAVCLILSDAIPAQATSINTTSTNEVTWPSGPSVNADSAIVMELSTGTILYEKNAEKAQYPASITKVMTGLLAVENCSMDEIVTFSDTAVYGNGSNSSSIGMNVGEKLTMENCMYGMMLASANEVAKAIGEHIAGSLEDFITMMNDRAEELGCVNTHFANPNGLHDENHYTCAYDMALIARAAIQNATFKRISGTRVFVIPPTEMTDADRWVANTHQMINPAKLPRYNYDDCYAGKTGFTNEARYTLVSYAKRGNLDIVCVTMHSQMQTDQYEDSITLLDYAFDNFSVHAISKLDNAPSFDNFSLFTRFSPLFDMKNAPLSIDTDSYVILPNGASYSNVAQTITYHTLDSLEKGINVIGEVSYQYGDKTVGFTNILYESEESVLLTPPESFTHEDSSAGMDTDSTDSNLPQTPEDSEGEDDTEGISLKPFIIGGIILFLIILGAVYYILVELPHQRRRRAYYERKRKRREQDSYLDL